MFRGLGALVTRGAFTSAGHQLGYDGLKTEGKKRGYKDGPPLHFAASVSAAFSSASFCCPAH